ncbi:ribbon-helix-helix domain-containing protein [Thermodesulfobacteriota bacterium]
MPQVKQTPTTLISFRLQDNVLKAVDRLAFNANVTRSTVFRNAIAAYLEAHDFVITAPPPETKHPQPEQPQPNGERNEHHRAEIGHTVPLV